MAVGQTVRRGQTSLGLHFRIVPNVPDDAQIRQNLPFEEVPDFETDIFLSVLDHILTGERLPEDVADPGRMEVGGCGNLTDCVTLC